MIRTIPFFHTQTYVWPIGPYAYKIKRIRGFNGSATVGLVLQFHTGTQNSPNDLDISKPANATVPLDEFPLQTNSEILFDRAVDGLKDMVAPIVAVLSTTSGVLTAAVAENSTDWALDIEEYEAPPPASGITTTQNANASALNQIWAEVAAGTNKNCLYELVISTAGLAAGTYYLKIFPVNSASVADGTIPFKQFTVPANAAFPFQRLRFGNAKQIGLVPFQQGENAPADGIGNVDQTNHYGCTISLETAGGAALAANQQTAWKYQVKYGAIPV